MGSARRGHPGAAHPQRDGKPPGFWRLALSGPVVARAARVAAVVGTLLALINHGDSLLALSLSMTDALKMAFTYLVPYGVSTYSSVRALQAGH